MNADYVENIIRNIDKQSYKCILVDGAWGIGKSYMVRKALEDMKDRTCFISLFGMDDVQKIYHEAFFQLALRTSRGGKIANGAKGVAKAAGNFCAEITKLNGALAQAISERELFAVTASNFKKNRIIVIDDLERRKAGLDLEELFGVIEELKQSNYIKVILIANSNEIHENERTTFNKYKEKTIDRIFEVTEHSASIKWGVYGIDGEFIDVFLMHHKAKNLRTLQKAQNFYNDVKQYCLKIENEQFMNEVKMLCFAVVVEDVDKLYYKNDSTEKENTNSRYRKDGHILSNHLNVRLANYVHLQSSGALLDDIYNYFKSSKMLSEETLQKHYQKFKEAGNKANYYKTDEEIETYIQSWKAKLHEASNSVELTQLAGEYDYWFQVLEKDDDELIEYYQELLKNMFLRENRSDKRSPLDYYNSNEFHGATKKVRDIYEEVLKQTKKEIIRTYIEKLGGILDEEIAYEYSYWLKEWYTGTLEMHRYIDEEIDPLYQRNSFPVDNMSKTKKMVCYNVMTLLYLHDKEKLEKCYNSLKSDFSKMGIKRTEDILKEIREDN